MIFIPNASRAFLSTRGLPGHLQTTSGQILKAQSRWGFSCRWFSGRFLTIAMLRGSGKWCPPSKKNKRESAKVDQKQKLSPWVQGEEKIKLAPSTPTAAISGSSSTSNEAMIKKLADKLTEHEEGIASKVNSNGSAYILHIGLCTTTTGAIVLTAESEFNLRPSIVSPCSRRVSSNTPRDSSSVTPRRLGALTSTINRAGAAVHWVPSTWELI